MVLRQTDKMQDLTTHGIKPIALDVTKEDSVVAYVEQIVKEAGSIDILVTTPGLVWKEPSKTCPWKMHGANLK